MPVINTPQFRMAERMAGIDLGARIVADSEAKFSSEEIARRLYADYGIEVTGNTVRRWLALLQDPAA